MEVLESISTNKIAHLIDLQGLIEQGNCGNNEIKMSHNSLSFSVKFNPYFTHFEIEENQDETFELIFYLQGRNGLDIVDLEMSIPINSLKKIVQDRILGI
jgi:hypothetical protein